MQIGKKVQQKETYLGTKRRGAEFEEMESGLLEEMVVQGEATAGRGRRCKGIGEGGRRWGRGRTWRRRALEARDVTKLGAARWWLGLVGMERIEGPCSRC